MKRLKENIISVFGRADWPLLLFLIGITNTKIYVKLAAVIGYALFLLYRKYSFTGKPGSIFWFYLLMPVAGLIAAAIRGSFLQSGYPVVAAWGFMLWYTAGACCYLLRTRVYAGDNDRVQAAVKVFFLLNLIVSLGQLVSVMIAAGKLVPYWYYDLAEVYGASTGDYISGIFGGSSVTNSTVSALGAIWFLHRRNIGMAIACICSMMLCTSNITIALFLFTSMVMTFTVKKRKHRLTTIALFVLSAMLYVTLSPANIWYVEKTWKKFFGPRNEVATAAAPDFGAHRFLQDVTDSTYAHYKAGIWQVKAVSAADTGRHHLAMSRGAVAMLIRDWYHMPADSSPLAYWSSPGKLFAFRQTAAFLQSGAMQALVGAGMGNFSSKLATKATGLGIEGRFPESKIYVSKDYMQAHLYTALYYFAQPAVAHSMMNMPNSVYNQLAGEYGIAGLLLFACLYLGFFIRNRRQLKATRYMLIAVLLFFGYEYWFEMISLTVIFELLSLADIFCNKANERNATSARHGIDAGL